jgi:glyoxylase-like metal-dependent hydrolase (beta-lactamase superfamily II)
MVIKTLAEGLLGANCYLLESGGHAFIVDPAARTEVMESAIRDGGLTLDGILLTHGHFDHMTNLAPLLSRFPVPVYLGVGDRDFPKDGRKNAFSLFFGQDRTYPDATDLLRDGDTLTLGTETLAVIATPGHSGGSVVLLCGDVMVAGDTLFAGSCGRCDLFGGNLETMFVTLKRLAALEGDYRVYPGHGPDTTLSRERRTNPYVKHAVSL